MEETKYGLYQMYKDMLTSYLQNKSEHALYHAQQFSKEMMEKDMSPEETVSLHLSVFQELADDLPEQVVDSFDLLLEVMIGYGLAYREHQSLRDRQRELDSELNVAARMQKSLLPAGDLDLDDIEIGVVSVPAGKMSGDYYHYMKDEDRNVGIAVADVIGKGVPAAMSMSMIKYAMDTITEQTMDPGQLLESINRVVERNIEDDMFITMMYGYYDADTHRFSYASAGHEPGFVYDEKEDTFSDLEAKGLVLGVSSKVAYTKKHLHLDKGDFIVLLSDGVTECRIDGEFIERNQIAHLIREKKHLPAQDIVDEIYHELEKAQEFQLRDDFTLQILRRKV
ncbi:PP2C family protein-serine/threonine phosphatase [Salisediminibacterium halotolerans]|uniref:PP2C family protein-serine/threonine phosphatase n=1 Tax=Salisediminibacterium halotolerans TaxID=517425 RepID=UPI000EAEFA77|nr:PP2C family protein-serine/threonine phosphatase [Salisediminibacterium halotolerans]RLJ73301.1 sigma-B regulation protein RsbU (phosphoserine phosphatase) [Actinophytocola xinjiangensis]RPE86723.1 sigma-B regulation protein RsbU (phosphoserine phosphatase) [Salisediminibacterium halotolerans]TWG34098.1 sigma-B regulation protein RsbU (phosphoserine phosphatase) [Salisediminibacterium halotolerans]GEL07612.1 phosphoserine phosphatase RsbU [Salisediminibacterium halotolerans]